MNSISSLCCIALLVLLATLASATTIHSMAQQNVIQTQADQSIIDSIKNFSGFDLAQIFPNSSYPVDVFAADPGSYRQSFTQSPSPCSDSSKASTKIGTTCFGSAHSLGSLLLPMDPTTDISWVDESDHSKGLLVAVKNGDSDCAIPGSGTTVPTLDHYFLCAASPSFIITNMATCFYALTIKSPAFCI